MAARLKFDRQGGAHRKRFGQHFLRADSIVQQIIQAAAPLAGECVWEIGCGDGALTVPLQDRVENLRVIELDKDIVAAATAAWPGVEIVAADAVAYVRSSAALASAPACMVSNLPYSAGTAILQGFFAPAYQQTRLVVMLQKEVAERIRGQKRSAIGPLSVMASLLYDTRRVCRVPPGAFDPPPKVHSEVLSLVPRDDAIARAARAEVQRIWQLLSQAFSQRRKQLGNTLGASLQDDSLRMKRPEQLGLDDWIRVLDLPHSATPCGAAPLPRKGGRGI